MKLRFHAKGDALQRVPDFVPAVGQQDRYVGREFDPGNYTTAIDPTDPKAPPMRSASYPASKTPFECDSESPCGLRLRHLIFRDRDLWAADQATADFCQVPFVEIEWADGEWVPKKLEVAKAANSKKD
jgi:hypothetical protein